MRRRLPAGSLLLLVLIACYAAVIPPGPASAQDPTSPYTFTDRAYTPLTPARVLDTRTGLGAVSAGQVGAGGRIDVQLTGVGGVPDSGVDTVAFNLTGTQPTSVTYVTVYPAGQPRPTASNLNLVAGQTAPNLVLAKVGAGGKVTLFNNAGSVHLIIDVLGWFADGPDFTGVTPGRVLDTRSAIGAPAAVPVGPQGRVELQVTGRGGIPSDGVGAVAFNLTGTKPTMSTYVTAWPSGETRPTASNLNLLPGQTAPNLVIAKVGAGGKVTLFNNSGSVHLIADVVGWFAIGSDYSGLTPSRVLDSRTGLGASGAIGPNSTISIQVTGVRGVPADGVAAVVFNLTGTKPTTSTYVTAWPSGETRPTASNLNLLPGQTAPNLVVAKVGADGKVNLYNRAGQVHLIADVVGWISVGVTADVDKPAGTEIVDPGQVVSVSGSDLTVTGTPATIGEIVFVPPGATTTGTGLLGRVTSTGPVEGGTVLHTEPVRIIDAFPSGQISGSIDTRALASGAPPSAAKMLAARSITADPDGRITITTSRSISVPCQGHTLQIDVDLSVSARFTIDASWGALKLKRMRISFDVEVNGTVSVLAGLSLKCDFGVAPAIPLGTVWGFVATLRPVVQVELLAGVSETAGVTGRLSVGALYVDGADIHWIREGGPSGHFTPPTAVAEGKLKVSFGPELSLKFAGIAGPAFFGGVFTETLVSATADPWWRTDVGIEVSANFDLDLWFTQVSYTLALYEVGRITLARADGPWPGPELPDVELPPGQVGVAYDTALAIGGGRAPLSVTRTAGELPQGITLEGTHLVGTPVTAGNYSVTLEVRDADGFTDSGRVDLTIRPAPGGVPVNWTASIAPLPPDGNPDREFVVRAVACPGGTTCQAVGYYQDMVDRQHALLLTGSGDTWVAVPPPGPADGSSPSDALLAIACGGVTTCVAVGGYRIPPSAVNRPVMVVGSASSWTRVEVPLPADAGPQTAVLRTVACPSSTLCVAAGSYHTSTGELRAFTVTGSGTSWTAAGVDLPANALDDIEGFDLQSMTCPTLTSCVAVGDYVTRSAFHSTAALIVTGSGADWTAISPALPPDANANGDGYLSSVTCPSASHCVAVGSYADISLYNWGLIVTGSGESWSAQQAPQPADASSNGGGYITNTHVGSVSCPSESSCTAVGSYVTDVGAYDGLVLRGSTAGWTAEPAPLPADAGPRDGSGIDRSRLVAIDCPAVGSCLALGSYRTSSQTGRALILSSSDQGWISTGLSLPGAVNPVSIFDYGTLDCVSVSFCAAGGDYVTSGYRTGLILTGPGPG